MEGAYTITWRRLIGMMPPMVRVNNGLLIFPQTREEYSGQYYCIIRTSFGVEYGVQQAVTLVVLGMFLHLGA